MQHSRCVILGLQHRRGRTAQWEWIESGVRRQRVAPVCRCTEGCAGLLLSHSKSLTLHPFAWFKYNAEFSQNNSVNFNSLFCQWINVRITLINEQIIWITFNRRKFVRNCRLWYSFVVIFILIYDTNCTFLVHFTEELLNILVFSYQTYPSFWNVDKILMCS